MRRALLCLILFCNSFIYCCNSTEGRRHLAGLSSSKEMAMDSILTSLNELWSEGFDQGIVASAQAYQDFCGIAQGRFPIFSHNRQMIQKLKEKDLADEWGVIHRYAIEAYKLTLNKQKFEGK